MSILTPAQALQIRASLSELADLKRITEVATLTVKTRADVNITGLVALPVTLKTDMERSPDVDQQVEAIALVRRDELPTPLPRIDRTMKVTVTHEGIAAGPYTALRFVPHTKLATVYRLELRRTAGVTYG